MSEDSNDESGDSPAEEGATTESSSDAADLDLDFDMLSGAVIGGVVLALYASWMAADVVGRLLIFPLVALLTGYLLYQQDSPHNQGVYFGYGLAGLVFLTPLFMVLPDVLSADAYGVGMLEIGFMYTHFMLQIIFGSVAGIIAYITYRYDGGTGIVARARSRSTAALEWIREQPSE